MPDVFTKAKRSEVMSRIRGRGNKDTELALAKLFRRHHITGWRRHVRVKVDGGELIVERRRRQGRTAQRSTLHHQLTVTPDFVFLRLRVAVFVDGCFWHGCPKHATKPKNNAAFWEKKLSGNKARDRKVNRALRKAGWRVLRIWECALRRAGAGRTGKGGRPVSRWLQNIQSALNRGGSRVYA